MWGSKLRLGGDPQPLAPFSSAGVETLGAFNFTFSSGFFFLQSTKVEALGGTPEIATLLAVCDGFSPFVVRFCVPILGCPLLC